ncbi:MAG: hypoxanthine-guanine phosphoribosyltransferase [Gallionellales bacterium 35-53-114]|nr:MAG: hypoxanthine-guanine phosphoribosyltransferase [Gallionellales bacterium 35-53-114]OYZ63163.1 MAG: hypoxanthine-guanine phosphoribosyltransferase [Gallionellales bacterium 24-53-125]OZB08629.1 MAG: hypoxanthine-guanine phosphoribosyltransferase [Gallionellales bacterium 39-52-133]HQS57517.1 hypoxanthine-guanine phosphoribosyltransferase [Gallionellaceae bacterium]HQS74295.1 hypoxanthine-guanine phosphoribosyltransferase [Gallionellaceae bacterium]
MLSRQDAQNALINSEIIFSVEQVQAAVLRMAQEINAAMADSHPLVLSVMGGAVVFTGQLLPLLNFPLDFDYVHVSRYGNSQQGGEMKWKVAPQENVRGRVVLVVDDILDEGETLNAVKQRVMDLGASKFYSAIFADKMHGKSKPIKADFVGLEVPDRFVFGYGMDIHGAWRNLPAIHATKE